MGAWGVGINKLRSRLVREGETNESDDMDNKRYLDIVTDGQSYLNILYLLFSFPLGIFYFVFLITGLSLGVGLSVILIGIPLLLIIFVISLKMIEFERLLANKMLRVDIPPLLSKNVTGHSILGQLKNRLQDPAIWKGLIYLLTKFPLGILAFVITVTLIALTLGLITAPLTYQFGTIAIMSHQITTLTEALTVSILGLGIGLISLKILNGLARGMRKYADIMFRSSKQKKKISNQQEMIN
mgnify:CR=1 FL=1